MDVAADHVLAERVFRALDDTAGRWRCLHRKGRLLFALPQQRKAARKALDLYQPQRSVARAFVTGVGTLVGLGLGNCLPVTYRKPGSRVPLLPVERGTLGVMLGSPEHRVRRAIASYRIEDGWEVGKVAFGAQGRELLGAEEQVLRQLAGTFPGVPASRGRIEDEGLHLLRLPRLSGALLAAGDWQDAVALLEQWRIRGERMPASEFPEWPAIVNALKDRDERFLEHLSGQHLLPMVRHGDYARWNLIRTEAEGLMAIDWEWGSDHGMPGLDMAHFFAQDARLVRRLSPDDVVEETSRALRHPRCRSLIASVGWECDVESVLLASLAYTFGSGQQDNGSALDALLRRMEMKIASSIRV